MAISNLHLHHYGLGGGHDREPVGKIEGACEGETADNGGEGGTVQGINQNMLVGVSREERHRQLP